MDGHPDHELLFVATQGPVRLAEPFRKWVTEEILPTIRKTGSDDAAESTNPLAQALMDELKVLRTEVVDLKEAIEESTGAVRVTVEGGL